MNKNNNRSNLIAITKNSTHHQVQVVNTPKARLKKLNFKKMTRIASKLLVLRGPKMKDKSAVRRKYQKNRKNRSRKSINQRIRKKIPHRLQVKMDHNNRAKKNEARLVKKVQTSCLK